MTTERARFLGVSFVRAGVLAVTLVGLCLLLLSSVDGSVAATTPGEKLLFNKKSPYSHIKVTESGSTRTLWFVRDNGQEVIETMVNMARPHDLVIEYTQFMFASYAFVPKQTRVLIVGLGGGSMVHFLKRYDVNLKVDVVEIDPVIVQVADELFKVKSEGNVKIFTKDAFEYLKDTKETYDVIYMDAFLKPSGKTTSPGVPLDLQTVDFYRNTQKKLTPGGVMVFNLNDNPGIKSDLKNIRDALAQSYEFKLSRDSGFIVVGATHEKRLADADVQKAAANLDGRFKASFSFRDIGRTLVKR